MRTSTQSLMGLACLVGAAALGNAGWGAWQAERLGRQVAEAAQAGDIEMISSLTCAYCKEARAWFAAHEVPVGECFIERDPACAARFEALRGPGTPLLLVRGEPQVGFDPARVASALKAP